MTIKTATATATASTKAHAIFTLGWQEYLVPLAHAQTLLEIFSVTTEVTRRYRDGDGYEYLLPGKVPDVRVALSGLTIHAVEMPPVAAEEETNS